MSAARRPVARACARTACHAPRTARRARAGRSRRAGGSRAPRRPRSRDSGTPSSSVRSNSSRSASAALRPRCREVEREAVEHLLRRPQEALAVPAPLLLAALERRPAADRDEDVLEQRPPRVVRVDVARRHRLDADVPGEVAQEGVPVGVPALERALELDEEALAAERRREPGGAVRVDDPEPAPRTAREAYEPLGELRDHLERNRGRQRFAVLRRGNLPALPDPLHWSAFADRRLRRRLAVLPARASRPRVRGGEQAAEVPVAAPRLDEQRHVRATVQRHFRAGDRPDAERLRRVRELERAVDTVVVRERERLVPELGGASGELLRLRRPVEERVRRVAVQLDIGH